MIASDGKTAYYASDRNDSRGGLDLYTFEMRSDVRPAKTLWVRGRVIDVKTKKGLPSAVESTYVLLTPSYTWTALAGHTSAPVSAPWGQSPGGNNAGVTTCTSATILGPDVGPGAPGV